MTTPRLYWLVAIGLVVLGAVAGAAAVGEVRGRGATIGDIAEVSGPISVDAQTLYRALADADATAATGFLAADGESAELRGRYLDDIAKATAALTVALRDADDADADRLRVVADQLPVYTGLIETARSNQRLGVPLGGAYLREASGLMQQTILPAAAAVFDRTNRLLTVEHRAASAVPWAALLLTLLTGAALVAAQVLLSRRSRRTFNRGLLAASLVTVLALLWSGLALHASGRHLDTGEQDGAELVRLLANAGRASLQARANESLTLVARGGGTGFEATFAAQMDELIGRNGRSGLFARAIVQAPFTDRQLIDEARDEAVRWRELHVQVRSADDGGDWDRAVELATEPGENGLTAVFGRLDAALSRALDIGNDRVERQAARAGGSLTGLTAGLVLLTGGLVAGVVFGFRPRIGEYR
ncbi:hypothetical protein [Actinoplanes couchii]|uniref:Secreted protein n=1 Tax=Actinoplanes couchii TaxID=403638 RepID=A0ABQ3XF47_9ACTN|nr:hypothetical protein [Actinoplanes couchii]MDR6321915.1 hypothetical protein [Actinoplanes couchii]GID57130.1 hypothetical protein Aco03nite_055340 [Actinoplanes couchii]